MGQVINRTMVIAKLTVCVENGNCCLEDVIRSDFPRCGTLIVGKDANFLTQKRSLPACYNITQQSQPLEFNFIFYNYIWLHLSFGSFCFLYASSK